MKKLFVLVSCLAVTLVLSKVSVAQSNEAPGLAHSQSALSAADIVARANAPAEAFPFGFPPYPTVDGMPAFGIPYSYPRGMREARTPRFQRPLFSRFAPPPHHPVALPTPGFAPGPRMPQAQQIVAPPMTMGQVPQMEGVVTAVPAVAEMPVVVHRPTPIRNFRALMFAPRPYLGFDPYAAGFPPFPGYLPPM